MKLRENKEGRRHLFPFTPSFPSSPYPLPSPPPSPCDVVGGGALCNYEVNKGTG